MIPGIAAGQMRATSVTGGISFVAATGASYVGSATTISAPSSPSGIADGDGLFAIVMTRSVLTPPAGWTLVATQALAAAAAAGSGQWLHIYRKDSVTAANSSTAFVWTQASAARMGLAYAVLRSSTGAMSVAETAGVNTSYTTPVSTYNPSAPVLTATGNELLLLAATRDKATSSGSDESWSPTSGATLRTPASAPENRLVCATQTVSPGQGNAATWQLGGTVASIMEFGSLTVRVVPA